MLNFHLHVIVHHHIANLIENETFLPLVSFRPGGNLFTLMRTVSTVFLCPTYTTFCGVERIGTGWVWNKVNDKMNQYTAGASHALGCHMGKMFRNLFLLNPTLPSTQISFANWSCRYWCALLDSRYLQWSSTSFWHRAWLLSLFR